jgi:hypothetical protein
MPVVGITTVEIDMAGAVGGDAPVGEGPHAAHPGGDALELKGREEIGAETVCAEAALSLKIAGQLMGGGRQHPAVQRTGRTF